MIEVYKYEETDLDRMTFNRWAWPLKSKKQIKFIKKYLLQTFAFTVYDVTKDKPVAVIAFHFYGKGIAYGMLIGDKEYSKNPKYTIVTKCFWEKLIKNYKIEYAQTVSEDTPELNKWHEFLGFHKEKSLPGHLRGRDFILWSM